MDQKSDDSEFGGDQEGRQEKKKKSQIAKKGKRKFAKNGKSRDFLFVIVDKE